MLALPMAPDARGLLSAKPRWAIKLSMMRSPQLRPPAGHCFETEEQFGVGKVQSSIHTALVFSRQWVTPADALLGFDRPVGWMIVRRHPAVEHRLAITHRPSDLDVSRSAAVAAPASGFEKLPGKLQIGRGLARRQIWAVAVRLPQHPLRRFGSPWAALARLICCGIRGLCNGRHQPLALHLLLQPLLFSALILPALRRTPGIKPDACGGQGFCLHDGTALL
jgi:hypothetical protein